MPCGEVFHDLAHKSDQELEFVPVVCVEHNVIINEISIFILILNGTRKGLIIHVKKLKTVAKHTLLSYDLCDTLCTQKSRLCPGAD